MALICLNDILYILLYTYHHVNHLGTVNLIYMSSTREREGKHKMYTYII